jgi:hypothetical protein
MVKLTTKGMIYPTNTTPHPSPLGGGALKYGNPIINYSILCIGKRGVIH